MINYSEIARSIVNGNRSTARQQILSSANPAATALYVASSLAHNYEYTYPSAISTVLVVVDP